MAVLWDVRHLCWFQLRRWYCLTNTEYSFWTMISHWHSREFGQPLKMDGFKSAAQSHNLGRLDSNDQQGTQRLSSSSQDLISEQSDLYRTFIELSEQHNTRQDFNAIRNLSSEPVTSSGLTPRPYPHFSTSFYPSNLAGNLQAALNLPPGGDLHRLSGQNIVYPSQFPGPGGDAASLLYSQYAGLQPRSSPSPYQNSSVTQTNYYPMNFTPNSNMDFTQQSSTAASSLPPSQPSLQSFPNYLPQSHLTDSVPLVIPRCRDNSDQQAIDHMQSVSDSQNKLAKQPDVGNLSDEQALDIVAANMPSALPATFRAVFQHSLETSNRQSEGGFQETPVVNTVQADHLFEAQVVGSESINQDVQSDFGGSNAQEHTSSTEDLLGIQQPSVIKDVIAALPDPCENEENASSSSSVHKSPNIEVEEGVELLITNGSLLRHIEMTSFCMNYKCKKCGFSSIKLQKFIDHFGNLRKHPKEKTKVKVSDRCSHSGSSLRDRSSRRTAMEAAASALSFRYGKHDLRKPLKKRRSIHLHKDSHRVRKLRSEKDSDENEHSFMCFICRLRFPTELLLAVHEKCHSDGSSEVRGCYLCDYQVPSEVAEKHHSNKLATLWELLHEHISQEHPEAFDLFTCKSCHSKFETQSEFNEHALGAVVCEECEVQFCSLDLLEGHRETCVALRRENEVEVHETVENESDVDSDKSDEKLSVDESISQEVLKSRRVDTSYKTKRKMVVCSLKGCNSRLSSENERSVHELCHKNGDTSLSCYLCNFKPHRKCVWSVIKRHFVSVHPGVITAKFSCEICDKGFTSQSQLDEHRFAHSEDRDQVCEQCGALFKRPSHLAKHIDIVHKGIKFARKKPDGPLPKAHMCHLCGHATTTKKQLTSHLNIHLNLKPHKCPLCDFCASDPSTVRKHRRRHLDVKKFKCELCDYRCNFRQNLRHHMNTNHKNDGRPFSMENLDNGKELFSDSGKTDLQTLLSMVPQTSIIDQASKIAQLNQTSGSDISDSAADMGSLWQKFYPAYASAQSQNPRTPFLGDSTNATS